MNEIYLTRNGFEKLSAELVFLKTTKRKDLSREIGEARAHGDISENAEYDAAKEAQGLNEKRIAELEEKLMFVKIIDDLDIPKDKVYIGATVTLENLDTGDKLTHSVVAAEELDFAQGNISILSPLAKGLLGHKEGDEVDIQVPAGILRYKVVKITR